MPRLLAVVPGAAAGDDGCVRPWLQLLSLRLPAAMAVVKAVLLQLAP